MYKINYLISEVAKEVAAECGLSIIIEPEYQFVGQITTKQGKKYFRKNDFDLNPLGAAVVANDKAYAAFFLQQMGYPTPQHEKIYTDRFADIINSAKTKTYAKQYATELSYPVIVKPNSQSQGIGVEKVYNEKELEHALNNIFFTIKDRIAIIEEYLPYADFRVVVLDNEVISAYQRIPLHVIGNGSSTIQELLIQKQKDFEIQQRETIIKTGDYRIAQKLKNTYHMHIQSVPKAEEVIYLLDAANLSAGGESVDCIETIHPSFAEIAIKISHDMGLRYCGVDIMIDGSITQPAQQNYKIIEVNAAADLDHYAYTDEKQESIVREMYRKVITAMTK